MKKTKGFLLAVAIATMTFTFSCSSDDGDGGGGQFNPNIQYTSFTDNRDKKTYKMMTIGSLTWMAENLNYNASGSECIYDWTVGTTNCEYGRVYNWSTALTVCPNGWHLPSQADWDELSIEAMLLGGFTSSDIGFGSFGKKDGVKPWWSSSEYNSDNAYARDMYTINGYAGWDTYGKSDLLSVRCLRN